MPEGVGVGAEDGAHSLAGHDSRHALRLGGQADDGVAAGGGGDARRRDLGGHAAGAPLGAAAAGVHLQRDEPRSESAYLGGGRGDQAEARSGASNFGVQGILAQVRLRWSPGTVGVSLADFTLLGHRFNALRQQERRQCLRMTDWGQSGYVKSTRHLITAKRIPLIVGVGVSA